LEKIDDFCKNGNIKRLATAGLMQGWKKLKKIRNKKIVFFVLHINTKVHQHYA